MFYVHLYLGKVSNLSIFFKWVVQPATRNLRVFSDAFFESPKRGYPKAMGASE